MDVQSLYTLLGYSPDLNQILIDNSNTSKITMYYTGANTTKPENASLTNQQLITINNQMSFVNGVVAHWTFDKNTQINSTSFVDSTGEAILTPTSGTTITTNQSILNQSVTVSGGELELLNKKNEVFFELPTFKIYIMVKNLTNNSPIL